MLVATVPTKRVKMQWQEYIKCREDFDKAHATGLFYVWWPDLTWQIVEEHLRGFKDGNEEE